MLAVLLLLAWPVAEVYVVIKVADAIGGLLTAALLIASWPAGSWALRSRGRAAWARLREELSAGRPPGRAVLDGALILAGGLLLIVPGFISDAVGIELLLPPTRSVLRRVVARRLVHRLRARAGRVSRAPRGYDVDSTATDVDQPALHR